jgi:hypothetical protein
MNRGIAVVTLAALVAVGIYSQRAGGAAAPSTAQTAALRAIDEASASLSQLETKRGLAPCHRLLDATVE